MSACFIFGALPVKNLVISPKAEDMVIACDKGVLVTEQFNITPTVIIGDFDSLGYTPNLDNVIKLPVCKDDTDVGYALKYAVLHGADVIYIYGASGGKLDHSMANVQLSQMYSKKGVNCVFLGETNFCSITNGSLAFPEKCNGRISVFSSGVSKGVDISGLAYTLQNAKLDMFPLGVSNAFTGAPAQISVKRGTLTVMWEAAVIPVQFMQNNK